MARDDPTTASLVVKPVLWRFVLFDFLVPLSLAALLLLLWGLLAGESLLDLPGLVAGVAVGVAVGMLSGGRQRYVVELDAAQLRGPAGFGQRAAIPLEAIDRAAGVRGRALDVLLRRRVVHALDGSRVYLSLWVLALADVRRIEARLGVGEQP